MHALLALLLLAAPAAKAVVLRHALVLPASRAAIPDGAVVMQGGKILAVGPSASVASPAGATEIDLTGKVVTPGSSTPTRTAAAFRFPGAGERPHRLRR